MKLKTGLLLTALLTTPTMASAKLEIDKLEIELSLSEITTGQYHRPYTAVWVEDASGQPVKTIALWVQSDGHKWFRDLRRWWRKSGRDNPALIDATSGATRPAGSYQLSWDLTNDQGQPLPAGNYEVFIEVVREKGGRELIREPLSLPLQPLERPLAPTGETGPGLLRSVSKS